MTFESNVSTYKVILTSLTEYYGSDTHYFTGHNIQNQEQITARDVDVTQ
jgi:hypothetical protein